MDKDSQQMKNSVRGEIRKGERFPAPPSLRSTPHLRDKRELFGRLIQCCTGHDYVGDFYVKIDTTNPACPCGEPYQTCTHVLRDCRLYRNHRYILEEISPLIFSPDILGTHEEIQALAEFPLESNAFTRSGTNPPSTIDCQRTTSMRNSRTATQQQHTTQLNLHILYFFISLLSPRHSHNITFEHTTILLLLEYRASH